jgi:sulfite reductase beta subunit-like hemoprotein/TusA-related sulfurtransferase
MFYEIPASLPGEIAELESQIDKFQRGELDAVSLKARRVPFGCYEQRKDGTYMLRVRTTGGALTPRQLRVIASLSAQYGASAIHITTRQEFQIHDVALEHVITVMRGLLEHGLATRGGGGNTVRNIMVSPDSGVCGDEIFDPSPYAFTLTSRLIAQPSSWMLPRKFKISFSGSEKDTAYARFNDLGFLASIRDGVKGFKVYVAGGMGAKPEVAHLLHEFIPTEDVYVVAEAVKRVFDKHGNRKNRHAARLRFLWNQTGEARFRELYAQELEAVRAENPPAFAPAKIAEDAVARSADAVRNERTASQSAEFLAWKRRYCSEQPQPGLRPSTPTTGALGTPLYSVLIPAFLGNIDNQEAIALADLLAPLGEHVVRATFGQNLRLRNIPAELLAELYPIVQRISELSAAPALLANSIACTGADTCKLGICLSKGALRAIARELTASGLDLDQLADFKINLSGCPNTCGQHMIADLGFYGNVGRKEQQMFPAYGIVAGAVVGEKEARLARHLDRINARDLPAFVVELLKVWLEKKPRFASFAEYVDAEGAADIRDIVDRYRKIPELRDDRSYFVDWGSNEVFSLVGKGVGECSAGLFDLIEVDNKQIDALRQRWNTGLREEERGEVLYTIALSASRMLLVTRGIEAPSDAAVFANFGKHFIEAGLVDSTFKPLVELARQKDLSALRAKSDEVFALADAVKALYAGMDNSLRFAAEAAKPAPPTAGAACAVATKPATEKDLRGVRGPDNFVKVKLSLARLKSGEHLSVLLDDGPPMENVPRSVTAEGHKVLSQTRVGDYWSVLIEKG